MPYTPPSRPSIRLIRSSPYKGGTHEWSNRFFFTGGNFTTAQFNALCDLLRDDWKGVLLSHANIVRYIGYDIGSDVPVFTRTATTAGTYATTNGNVCPLESCVVARLTTTQRTSKNHPIYGFKYLHGVQNQGAGSAELPLAGFSAAVLTRCNDMLAGYNDGTAVRNWCDARGAVFQAASVLPYISHRDFPN